MAITKKPTTKPSELLISDIINRGGSSTLAKTELSLNDKKENIKLSIRLPIKMLTTIDNYLENNISSKTRNAWIKEAIEERIKKEIEI